MTPVPLGGALSATQLAIACASCLAWLVLQHVAVHPAVTAALLPDTAHRALQAPASGAARRRAVGLNAANFVHSTIMAAGAIYLALADPVIRERPIFGLSPVCQALCAVSTGFFVWDVYVTATCYRQPGKVDWAMLTHGVLSFGCFLFGQYPFIHGTSAWVMGFELSTPFLNAFRSMYEVGMHETHAWLYARAKKGFFFSFFLARIVVGIPASALWWRDMLALLATGTAEGRPLHSAAIVYFYLAANGALNLLNVVWFRKIVAQALASGKKAKAA